MSSDAEILAPRPARGEAKPLFMVGQPAGRGHGTEEITVRHHQYEGNITMANTQQQPLLIGPAVGQAQAVLNRLLSGILAESGTSRQDFLALQRLTALGGQAPRDAYERDLSRWFELDGPAARQLADEVLSAGLVSAEADGTVRLSAPGRALREQVLAASARTTGPVLAAIDPEHLEITVRTLDEITRQLAAEVDR